MSVVSVIIGTFPNESEKFQFLQETEREREWHKLGSVLSSVSPVNLSKILAPRHFCENLNVISC